VIKTECCDILRFANVDAIVNAANGIGVMGAGVAGAIGRTAGKDFLEHVREFATTRPSDFQKGHSYPAGSAYTTYSGNLGQRGIKYIIHAVTMRYPGSQTDVSLVASALHMALREAKRLGLNSLVIPALGTGIGGLDKKAVALAMIQTIKLIAADLDVVIVDIDPEFIRHVDNYLKDGT
jgi:O-acetyl-ADP-ribose deacetylase (regulator of RNase III)